MGCNCVSFSLQPYKLLHLWQKCTCWLFHAVALVATTGIMVLAKGIASNLKYNFCSSQVYCSPSPPALPSRLAVKYSVRCCPVGTLLPTATCITHPHFPVPLSLTDMEGIIQTGIRIEAIEFTFHQSLLLSTHLFTVPRTEEKICRRKSEKNKEVYSIFCTLDWPFIILTRDYKGRKQSTNTKLLWQTPLEPLYKQGTKEN